MKNLNQLIHKIMPQATSMHPPTNTTTNPFNQNPEPLTKQAAAANTPPVPIEIHLDDMITWLNQKGKQLYGSNFHILPADYEIIYQLLIYFFRDQTQASKYGIDFQKGLLISGPIGCGKTSLLNLFRILVIRQAPYQIISCRDISLSFMEQGFSILKYYTGAEQKKPAVFCFDDLGVETNMKYFGNQTNVMAEILLSRYDLLINRQIKTHITTNLSATELEAAYGNRIRSRMRQMFNLIAFDTQAADKRK